MERRLQLAELCRGFVPPEGLNLSRPREVELSAGGKFLFGLAMLLFAGAIGAGLALWRIHARESAAARVIETTGVDTKATVVRLTRRSDEEKAAIVEYTFDANGREYHGKEEVPLSMWRSLDVGSPFGVRYSAPNPELSVRQDVAPHVMPRFVPFLVADALAIFGTLCVFAIRRQRDLLAEGRIAPARVTAHKKDHTSHGGTHRSMTYEFAMLSGAVATGRAGTSSKPPAIGSVICVVYDPERPSRSAVYPLQLVRPAR